MYKIIHAETLENNYVKAKVLVQTELKESGFIIVMLDENLNYLSKKIDGYSPVDQSAFSKYNCMCDIERVFSTNLKQIKDDIAFMLSVEEEEAVL